VFRYANRRSFAKLLAHYEVFKLVQTVPGHIVEYGVFKGESLLRFAQLIEGDIRDTLPRFVQSRPGLKTKLVHLNAEGPPTMSVIPESAHREAGGARPLSDRGRRGAEAALHRAPDHLWGYACSLRRRPRSRHTLRPRRGASGARER